MNTKSITRSVSLLAIAGLLPAAMLAAPSPDPMAMQKEGIALIGQLEDVARSIRFNAGQLNSFANTSTATKWIHLYHLGQIKELVNEGLKPALVRLVEIQPHLPAWKQESVNKMLDAARNLAADTNSALIAKREAGATPPVMNVEYKAAIAKVYEHAEILVKTSDAAQTYASSQLKASQAGLNVPR